MPVISIRFRNRECGFDLLRYGGTVRTVCINAYAIQRTVYANAAGETLDGCNDVLFLEIDDLRDLVLCHGEPAGDCVNGQDASCIAKRFAVNSQRSHVPAI